MWFRSFAVGWHSSLSLQGESAGQCYYLEKVVPLLIFSENHGIGLCPYEIFSVGDPDPQDPNVFGHPGSGSISQRYRSGSFPFLIKVLSGLK